MATNEDKDVSIKEPDTSLSEMLDKVDEELGYPEIEVDQDKLDDIWNALVD